MKKLLALCILFIVAVGCRGKDGEDGTDGGEMRTFTGVITADGYGVQDNNFDIQKDMINVYYRTPGTAIDLQLFGPISPGTTSPYYQLLESGPGVLIEFNNVPVGSTYRILIWRGTKVF